MIIGSGLIANSLFQPFAKHDEICIYAAGVSNSNCTNAQEFERERKRVVQALQQTKHVDAFVYFGTCSVYDPEALNTPYVQHKLAMEKLVQSHPRNLILRLPQVVGETPNPHTLLNYLFARIARSESFTLWSKARRNIIDVNDVAAIARQLVIDNSARNVTLNIANTTSYRVTDIVAALERLVGKNAVYTAIDRGSEYPIDVSAIVPFLGPAGVMFGNDYLENLIHRYYEKTE
jgi:nucleoside-diphosphate-sugar epimerase